MSSESSINARLTNCTQNLIEEIEKFKELSKRPHVIPPEPIQALITTGLKSCDLPSALIQCSNTKGLLDSATKILNYEDRRRKLDMQLNNVEEERLIKENIKTRARAAKRQKLSIDTYLEANSSTSSLTLPETNVE